MRRPSSQSAAETTGLKWAPGDRAEGQDQRAESERRRDRVLQQLQADVIGRQALRSDARSDDHSDEQPGADELGQQPSTLQRDVAHQHGRFGATRAARASPANCSDIASSASGASR